MATIAPYPWSPSSSDDNDYHIANIGQLKNTFNIHLGSGIIDNSDPDNDGLSNFAEMLAGTDPHNPDSDGDQLPDAWEVQYLRHQDHSPEQDLDNDTLTLADEQALGLHPIENDLVDPANYINYSYDANGRLIGAQAHHYHYDPAGNLTATTKN